LSAVSPSLRIGALAVFALLAPSAMPQTSPAAEVVATTVAVLASTIESRRSVLENDLPAVYALVDDLLLPRFDMERGGRAILANHWESATAEERSRFVTAFYNYLVASYGDLLLYFTRETLRVLPFDGDPDVSPARVRTILTLNDGTQVNVAFILLDSGDGWKVVDVVAEGVSYVRTFRSQFRVEIATEGLDSVIDWLEQKAAPRFAGSQP
jgi:phospholipid transport system substrate-binding protein